MSKAKQVASQRAGRRSVGAAISRLSQYVVHNRGYYSIWVGLTLLYAGTFLMVPLLTGRTIGAIERGDDLRVP